MEYFLEIPIRKSCDISQIFLGVIQNFGMDVREDPELDKNISCQNTPINYPLLREQWQSQLWPGPGPELQLLLQLPQLPRPLWSQSGGGRPGERRAGETGVDGRDQPQPGVGWGKPKQEQTLSFIREVHTGEFDDRTTFHLKGDFSGHNRETRHMSYPSSNCF